MFQEQGIDISKPEGEIRSRVQEVFDGFKKYVELEKRLAKTEKALAAAEGSSAEFETRLGTVEQSRERLEKEVADLRSQVALRETDIGKLNDEIDVGRQRRSGSQKPIHVVDSRCLIRLSVGG